MGGIAGGGSFSDGGGQTRTIRSQKIMNGRAYILTSLPAPYNAEANDFNIAATPDGDIEACHAAIIFPTSVETCRKENFAWVNHNLGVSRFPTNVRAMPLPVPSDSQFMLSGADAFSRRMALKSTADGNSVVIIHYIGPTNKPYNAVCISRNGQLVIWGGPNDGSPTGCIVGVWNNYPAGVISEFNTSNQPGGNGIFDICELDDSPDLQEMGIDVNNSFLMVGMLDNKLFKLSPPYTIAKQILHPKSVQLRSICHWNGITVAVGDSDGIDNYIITSSDYGETWTERSPGCNYQWLRYVTRYGDRFVAFGSTDGVGSVVVTSDFGGENWAVESTHGLDKGFKAGCFVDNYLIVGGNVGPVSNNSLWKYQRMRFT